MVLDNRLATVTESVGLRAPDTETRPLVQSLRPGCCRGDAEVNPGYARQRAGVPNRCIEKLGRNTSPAMAGRHVHAPQVRFVRRLEMAVSIHTYRTDEIIRKCADDDEFRRAPDLLANRLGIRREIIGGRGGECKRRVQQRLAPEFCISLSVLFAQYSNHQVR